MKQAEPVVPDVLLRMWDVCRRMRLSPSCVYDRIARGLFPPFLEVGARASALPNAELDRYLAVCLALREQMPTLYHPVVLPAQPPVEDVVVPCQEIQMLRRSEVLALLSAGSSSLFSTTIPHVRGGLAMGALLRRTCPSRENAFPYNGLRSVCEGYPRAGGGTISKGSAPMQSRPASIRRFMTIAMDSVRSVESGCAPLVNPSCQRADRSRRWNDT